MLGKSACSGIYRSSVNGTSVSPSILSDFLTKKYFLMLFFCMSDGLLRFVLELSLDFMVVFNFGLSLLLGGNKCNILFVFIYFLADSIVLSSDFWLSFILGLSFNSWLSPLSCRGDDVIFLT